MKLSLHFLCFCLLLAFLPGCDAPCKDIACLNGGTCDDGRCHCPEPFTGDDCSIQIPQALALDSARIYREGDLAHCPILGGPYQIYYFWTIVDNVSNDTLYQSNETLIGANVDQASIGDRLYVLNDPPELAFDRSFTIHFATRCVPSDGSPDQFLTNSWMGNFAPKGLYPEDNSTELTAFLFSFEVELYGRWVYGR